MSESSQTATDGNVEVRGAIDPLQEKIWQEVQDLGLKEHIAELDVRGYTVIPPKLATPDGLSDRLLGAVLDVAERRNNERPDLATGATHRQHQGFAARLGHPSKEGVDSPIGDLMQSILLEDRVFEEALMNPVLLALATYLCGYGVVLNSMGCFMKGPNDSALPLHTDTPLPTPLPPYSVITNLTYVLTDFTRENGATAVLPGSHKWCRAPTGPEVRVKDNPHAVAIECPAGSLICWHGNLWHGAFNRTATGLRVSIPVYMARAGIRTQEGLIDAIPQTVLERNPARFAILTHQGIALGWDSHTNSIEGARRAGKYQAAWAKELGVPRATMHESSLFA